MTNTPKTRTRAKKTMPLTAAERMGRAEDFGVSEGIGSGSTDEATEEDLARQAANQERLARETEEAAQQQALRDAVAKMSPEELLEREVELMNAAAQGASPEELRAALENDPYVQEAKDIRARLAELEKNEPGLQGLLDKLETERDEIETKEQERAGSPLALTLEVVECEFASTHYPDPNEGTIPTYAFGEQPCIYGKTRPDQDCRTCVHHRIAKYGKGAPMSERRYFNHGWIIPIPDDATAEKLANYIKALGMANLRNIDMEIALVRRFLDENKRQREDLIRVQQYRAQGGR
jgi:hypothetical protein